MLNFEVAFDYSYDGTLCSLKHSLQRLQTNAVDIVLIHDVIGAGRATGSKSGIREAMSGASRAV